MTDIDGLKELSKRIVEGRQVMSAVFEDEAKIKARVLTEVLDAVKDCLPHISSKLPFGAPYDTGIELLTRRDEVLYLSEEGRLFTRDEDGLHSPSNESIMRDRWDLRELVLALADEMQANLEGQSRKVDSVEKVIRKVDAIATLLKGT